MAEVLRNRPLLVLAIGFLVGLSLREYPWNALALIPLALLVRIPGRCLALAFGFACGMGLSPRVPTSGVSRTQYIVSPAVVTSIPRLYPNRLAYEIEIQGHRLTVTESSGVDRSFGDRLLVAGLVKQLREGSESFALSRGIVGRFQPLTVEVVSQGPSWHRTAIQFRRSFVEFTKRSMPLERAAVLDALCFNVEGGLSEEFEKDLRNTGTIHIISASGLHVLILATVIDWLLGLAPIPRALRLLLLGGLLVFYAAAAGLQPAIIRSVLMSMVALTAYLWRRECDLLSALALSAVAYLAWEPLGIYNIGFQISFLTVAAFALFGRFVDTFPKTAWGILREQAKEALQTTLVAYWATLPLLAFYFGTVSIAAIPSNLVIVPVVMALVVGGVAAFAISQAVPGLSAWIADSLLSPLATYLEWVLNLFGNLSISSIPGGFFSGYWLVPIYLLSLFWVRERVRPA